MRAAQCSALRSIMPRGEWRFPVRRHTSPSAPGQGVYQDVHFQAPKLLWARTFCGQPSWERVLWANLPFWQPQVTLPVLLLQWNSRSTLNGGGSEGVLFCFVGCVWCTEDKITFSRCTILLYPKTPFKNTGILKKKKKMKKKSNKIIAIHRTCCNTEVHVKYNLCIWLQVTELNMPAI